MEERTLAQARASTAPKLAREQAAHALGADLARLESALTGTEDRQHVYVALTRGTDANHAYVFTASLKRADPVPGPRPAPDPGDRPLDQGRGRRAPDIRRPPRGSANVQIPSEDSDCGDLGPAFPAWTCRGREPILQPSKPEIPPSPRILERVMDRDAGWEAAD